MKFTLKKALWDILRLLPLVVCLLLAGVCLLQGEVTAEGLLQKVPRHPVTAAGVLLLLYAVKSLTMVFPIVVLNVLGGFLFDPITALVLNCLGVLIELAIPYGIGRISGARFADKLCRQHPRVDALASQTAGRPFFSSFFLRLISCLPGDAVSLYFGAIRMPFGTYLWGSFLGTVPGVIPATLLGMTITDPTSPLFWLSIGLTLLLSALSFLLYWWWQRRKQCSAAQKNG